MNDCLAFSVGSNSCWGFRTVFGAWNNSPNNQDVYINISPNKSNCVAINSNCFESNSNCFHSILFIHSNCLPSCLSKFLRAKQPLAPGPWPPKAGRLAGQATMYVGSPPCMGSVPHHAFGFPTMYLNQRYQVSGIKYQVSGIRYQVSGIRYQVSGIGCFLRIRP